MGRQGQPGPGGRLNGQIFVVTGTLKSLTREAAKRRIKALGGRVAEELELGDISTGASNDLERATAIIRNMITVYGMSEELGALTYGSKGGEVFLGRDFVKEKNYSEEIASRIDAASMKYMEACYNRTRTILTEHRDKMAKVAEKLMEQEILSREEFEALMEDKEEQSEKE